MNLGLLAWSGVWVASVFWLSWEMRLLTRRSVQKTDQLGFESVDQRRGFNLNE